MRWRIATECLLALALGLAVSQIATAQSAKSDDRGPTHPADDPESFSVEVNPYFHSESLRYVEDHLPIQNERQNRYEARCYEELFLHARRMPADLLERASARNIKFYQLFGEDRAELRGCLVRVAGQLRLLRGYDPPVGLKNDDRPLELMYEAWIFDADAGSNPCCVVFSELPEGLQVFESKPNEREYPFVEADAFLFKRYRYGARDAAREAPFLMARTIRVAKPAMARSAAANPWDVPTSVILTTLGLIGLAALGMGTMVLWFRRDDARARARLRRSAPSAFHDREPENPFSDRGPMGGSPSLN